MSTHIAVLMTAGSPEEAVHVARALVEGRLVACCNIVPQIRSIYRWQGQVHDESEVLLIAKTRRDLLPSVIRKVTHVHSYEVPEITAVPIEGGLDAYLSWIDDCVAQPGGESPE